MSEDAEKYSICGAGKRQEPAGRNSVFPVLRAPAGSVRSFLPENVGTDVFPLKNQDVPVLLCPAVFGTELSFQLQLRPAFSRTDGTDQNRFPSFGVAQFRRYNLIFP